MKKGRTDEHDTSAGSRFGASGSGGAALSGGAFGDYLGEGESGSVRGFVCDARFALDVCLDPAAGSEGVSAVSAGTSAGFAASGKYPIHTG